MFKKLGFREKWVGWSQHCLISNHISVLVNGSPLEEFVPQRGLRQGNLLATFLFTIIAKGLSGMMRETISKKLFEGFHIGKDKVEPNLLQYANDSFHWEGNKEECGGYQKHAKIL